MTASHLFPMERLDALLAEAVREACLLESALEREMAALSNRDVDALNEAVARKHQAAQSLERLTQAQTGLLQAGGFDSDGSGMEACLRDWDHEGVAQPRWHRLQEVMGRCRHLNQVNGGVVHAHQQQVQQAIQILRGGESRTELYDPRGRTVSDGPSRHISKA
ncbi:flagella synthesis protein FlgN [Thioalkalivibrio sp.]|uniref:flagella synthesis protein FlgN n=1 Tax=Thioalkalivibrio sp. TaxID=2093813 RepID=UPI00397472BC